MRKKIYMIIATIDEHFFYGIYADKKDLEKENDFKEIDKGYVQQVGLVRKLAKREGYRVYLDTERYLGSYYNGKNEEYYYSLEVEQ